MSKLGLRLNDLSLATQLMVTEPHFELVLLTAWQTLSSEVSPLLKYVVLRPVPAPQVTNTIGYWSSTDTDRKDSETSFKATYWSNFVSVESNKKIACILYVFISFV